MVVKLEHPCQSGDEDGSQNNCAADELLKGYLSDGQESAQESATTGNNCIKDEEEGTTEGDDVQDDSDEEWLPSTENEGSVFKQKEQTQDEMVTDVSACRSARQSPRKSTRSAGKARTEIGTPEHFRQKRRCVEPSTSMEVQGPKRKRGRPPKGTMGHAGTGCYKCPQCGKQFDRKGNLTIHLDMHDREVEKKAKFHCRHCQGAFRSRGDLEKHLPKHGLSKEEVELEGVGE